MAFDPSIISQIPDFAPNPVKAKEEGYKLADMADTNTLNKMKLSDAKQQQEDEQKYRQVLKGRDWSTDKGATETAEAVAQAGLPDRAMQFMKERQAIKSGALDIQLKELDVKEAQQTAIAGTMDMVDRQLEAYKIANPGATPAMLDAKTQEFLGPAMEQLEKSHPETKPQIEQYKVRPGAFTYAGMQSAFSESKSGQAHLKQIREDLKGDRQEREQNVREQQANTQAVNAATSARREEAYAKNVESLTKLRDPGLLSDNVLALAVPNVMADKNAMTQFVSPGPSGKKQKDQINEAIAARLKDAGLSPEDLPRIRADTKAEATSIGKLIPQLNAVSAYEKLGKFNGEKLVQLVDQLDDTGIPLAEGPSLWAKQHVGGSTDAALFRNVLNAYQTEAARILNNPNMTGVLHRSSVDDMQHIISADVTAEQAKELVNRINLEMDFRAKSLQGTINEAGAAMTMPGGTPPAGAGGEGAAAGAGIPPPAGGGPAGAAPAGAPPATAAPTVPQYDPNAPGVGFWKRQ